MTQIPIRDTLIPGYKGGIAVGVVLWVAMLLNPAIGSSQERFHNSLLVINEADFSTAIVTPPSAFFADPAEETKWIVFGGLLVIAVLGSLAGYLLYKQKQLARARGEQMRLSGMLINAHEEERRRLAAELHDDFSQRLALLSLGIETAAEEAPRKLQEQLHELLNSASEIGADIHTLSHRLHSSTLERLGLVPAVSSLCKEFTAQQGIRAAFSHNDVPRSLASDVSLCLFRVVQESLRNVKKHSGGSRAEVNLNCDHSHLHLSISDNGAGFDINHLAHNHGLGILSMEERARLIGARLAICSEPQKGTRIDVWAPLNPNGHRAETYELYKPLRDESHVGGQR